ncbi:MAG: hypothetical protein AAF799_16650 [Myxococcota bacterium]
MSSPPSISSGRVILGLGALAITGVALVMLMGDDSTKTSTWSDEGAGKAIASGESKALEPDAFERRKSAQRRGQPDKAKVLEGIARTAEAFRPADFGQLDHEYRPDSIERHAKDLEGWLGESDNRKAAPSLMEVDCSSPPCLISVDFSTVDMSFVERAREYLANASDLGEPELIVRGTNPDKQQVWLFWPPGESGSTGYNVYKEAARKRVVEKWEDMPNDDPSMNP